MERKWTHVMFACGGIVLAWLLSKFGEWGWVLLSSSNRARGSATIGILSVVIASVATYIAWKDERLFGLANEVTLELSKVTWPTRKETQAATIVVIVTVFISAAFLKLFDMSWSWLTGLIYG